jgi:Domain of unknown function (DUF4411)
MKLGFDDKDSTIYAIDTSGLIKLESTFRYDNPTFSAVWEEIEDLIQQGRFRIIDFVEDEINDYKGKEDFIKNWVRKWRKELVYKTDEECYNAASPIINEEYSTGFFDAKKQAAGKEEADPYIIAYCKVNGCCLITNENKTKHNKIPAVSAKHGIKCIDIFDFLTERGLQMQRAKNKSSSPPES